jgi:GNAT superfamily N-acetyltransferase
MNTQPQAPGRERWPLLEAANMIEMLSYLGTSELAERQVTDEIELVITGVWDNTFNGVVRAELSEAGVGMAIDLSVIAEPFPPPSDLTIERAVDAADTAHWIDLHPHYLENDQRDEPRERLYISLGLDGDQPLRHYIARLGREPVGALSLFLGREAAGIYNVEVAPERQRRGVGTAMTKAVLEEARRLGSRVGVLGPTPESRSMYERLGFVLHRQALPMYWYLHQP